MKTQKDNKICIGCLKKMPNNREPELCSKCFGKAMFIMPPY